MNGYSDTQPKVLIVHPALAPYRVDLFNALADRLELRILFENTNVPYQQYDQAQLVSQLKAKNGILDRGVSIFGRNIRFGIARAIKEFDPEVVVTHEFSPVTMQVIARRSRERVPHIVWTADSRDIMAGDNAVRKWARRVVLPRIGGLVVYSKDTEELYRDHYGFTKPVGISPNLQAESFVRAKLDDALTISRSLVASYQLAGRKAILYVGRLATVKRVDRLIRAFADLAAGHENVVLILVGDGPERLALKTLAGNLGVSDRVIFAGHCEGRQLSAWYNIGTVFALTSIYEPWGAVVNEALIAGMPAVCTSVAAAKELIIMGKNGTVVNAQCNAEIVASLSEWLSRSESLDQSGNSCPRRSLMTRSFESAVNGFTSVVERVISLREPTLG